MRTGVSGIDHVMIAVRDLADAHRKLSRLGFTLSPRGEHSRLATANHTAMFSAGNYLELLTLRAPQPANRAFALPPGLHEGATALALRTSDPKSLRDALRAEGFETAEPIEFSRAVDDDLARFTTVALSPRPDLGLTVFACCHHTPELVWRPALLSHANGAMGLRRIGFVSAAHEIQAAAYGRLLGAPPVHTAWGFSLSVGSVTLEFRQALAPAAQKPPPPIATLGFAVASVPGLERYLFGAGVPFTADGAMRRVAASHAAGCDYTFEPAERRDDG
jgi:catechol 2,3-dioxygenase-like lactoylglutathione lyase family enzyme